MGPLRSVKARGLRRLGRLDVRLDGASLVLVGRSGCGKSTLLEAIALELDAEMDGRAHPALDIEASGGAAQELRMAFVSRPVQLRWERDFVGEWQKGAAIALHLDDVRTPAPRGPGPFETNAIAPRARVAPWLAATLAERSARASASADAADAGRHRAWIASVEGALRDLLGEPKLAITFPDGALALDLGDGRRPRLDELPRAQRTALDLFAELSMRVEAARRRAGRATLDPPGLALVDGIERDLDARLSQRLLPSLARHFPSVQWVVTTQSPLTALSLEGATVVDLGAREVRTTSTLRREGLEALAARMTAEVAPAPKSLPPPPGRLPPNRLTEPDGSG
ncbi:MAG: hypothetical protein KF729_15695 [Sandaracinaceae bacterium]|nr:hypothetical protein [Sandaracinaceae bacterium]